MTYKAHDFGCASFLFIYGVRIMDYPVMLYRRSLDDWKIAQDKDQEKELSEKGYRKHSDLKSQDKNNNDTLDIEEMTKADIMQNLDDLEVEYNNRDSKDKLTKLLNTALND